MCLGAIRSAFPCASAKKWACAGMRGVLSYMPFSLLVGYQSGQLGRTVNPLALPSYVRIVDPPPFLPNRVCGCRPRQTDQARLGPFLFPAIGAHGRVAPPLLLCLDLCQSTFFTLSLLPSTCAITLWTIQKSGRGRKRHTRAERFAIIRPHPPSNVAGRKEVSKHDHGPSEEGRIRGARPEAPEEDPRQGGSHQAVARDSLL